eukprot:TRINITY_DN4020_c0_g1_i1.p1 TRINITY_DN4020_c0_g1~~TRINITY_DN4020_c0_g1_i1.p1  ORF type:complete len:307 (+),score=48.85 TRINITY_DN4020_c0_g1_i1:416-1336(+)
MGGLVSWLKNWNSDSQWWHWTYFVDWGLMIVPFVVWAPLKYTGPRCRDFDPTDPAISHPYATHETFPSWTLAFIAGLMPIVMGMGLAMGPFKSRRVSWRHELHSLTLCVVQACLLAMMITDPIKNYVGRQRPDFLDRVRRELHIDVTSPTANSTIYMDTICSSTNPIIRDGMKSFPSGHSSTTFAGWVVLGMLVTSRVPLHGRESVSFWRVMLLCICFVFPSIVALSRTTDYRHNYSDVTAGTLVGIFSGMAVFKQHYSPFSAYPINRKTGTCDPYFEDETLTQEEAARRNARDAPMSNIARDVEV